MCRRLSISHQTSYPPFPYVQKVPSIQISQCLGVQLAGHGGGALDVEKKRMVTVRRSWPTWPRLAWRRSAYARGMRRWRAGSRRTTGGASPSWPRTRCRTWPARAKALRIGDKPWPIGRHSAGRGGPVQGLPGHIGDIQSWSLATDLTTNSCQVAGAP